ncbi:MAG TPA: TetR/AcrR family transcriptional regulator, partial [Ignavibacteriaceae bacterium]|nr:TetR/AcrR family transcriptional regulator [Ignavibacteriaceae bacterium]
GLNKTTLTEIARDIRIGKATIYHYFDSKEDLFFQSIEYDVSLFINDIKQIFNNEQLPLKEKFAEYFNYKQDLYNRYKLLYDVITRILKEEGIEKEYEIFKKLLIDEEEVLTAVLISHFKIENTKPELPKFFAMQSWGILFGKKLNDIRNNGVIQNSKELLSDALSILIK